MRKRDYYRQVLGIALRGAYGVGDATGFAIAGVAWLLLKAAPAEWSWAQSVNDAVVLVPLAVFGLFFVARLFVAPYWMYRDMADERDKARAATSNGPLDEVDAALRALRSHFVEVESGSISLAVVLWALRKHFAVGAQYLDLHIRRELGVQPPPTGLVNGGRAAADLIVYGVVRQTSHVRTVFDRIQEERRYELTELGGAVVRRMEEEGAEEMEALRIRNDRQEATPDETLDEH